MPRLNWWKTACAVCALCLTLAIVLPAQTLTTLYSFCSQSNCTDGITPSAALIQATNGGLYGATLQGGAGNDGTLFTLSTSGHLATLYDFCLAGGTCADGFLPNSALVAGANGDFYGTTEQGGPKGGGAFFELTLAGEVTTVGGLGGAYGPFEPWGLTLGANGDFYGTTASGGYRDRGTVFRITPQGIVTTLYRFCKTSPCAAGGVFPEAGLVEDADGNFYGTTVEGGAGMGCSDGTAGCGTVFRITPEGSLTTMHDFCLQTGCPDGWFPNALVQGEDGSFYGTTSEGGINNCSFLGRVDNGCGTVFKIGAGGFQTLYSFCPTLGCADGASPAAALVEGSDGNFYGTTALGGANMDGTIFKITPDGVFTLLYTFCAQSGCPDGAVPAAAMIQDTNGKFYGTTILGGTGTACSSGCGTIFSLSVGLGEFVEPEPNSGQAGAAINILGTGLDGATAVTFNGTAATFTVSSSSLITTTVPAGATTGKIEVATPHGTIRSNVRFRVLQ